MPRYQLSSSARDAIERKVDSLFDNLIATFIGPYGLSPGKSLTIGLQRADSILSLPGIFNMSASVSGLPEGDNETLKSLARIAANYINGARERAKAQIIHELDMSLSQENKDETSILSELEGKMAAIFTKATSDVQRIVETESTNARNIGIEEGIKRMSASMGVADPVVFKVTVPDNVRCETCKKLWLMEDGKTPRLYKLSELRAGYMTDRKNPFPTCGATHPHCRCTLTYLMSGYGFNAAGQVAYVSEGHDEFKKQRG